MITIRIYDRELTFIGLVTEAMEPSFTVQMSKVGKGVGQFKIHRGSEDLTRWSNLLDYKNIVVMHDSRTNEWFPWQIDKKNRVGASEGEVGTEVITVSGRGCLGLLDDAVVLSEHWTIDAPAHSSTRTTSFASKASVWFRPEEWVYTDAFLWVHDNTIRARQPRGFPDQLVQWMWFDTASGERPVETCYFRSILYVTVTAHVSIFCSADDAYDLWIGGEKVLSGTSWRRFERYDAVLEAGAYVVGIRAFNRAAGTGNRGGVLFSAWTSDPSSLKLLTNLRRSDSTNWATRDPALPIPGWDPGDIMKVFIQEGKDRGVNTAYAKIFCDWTDDADSDGHTWDDENRQSRDWSIGTKVLGVADKLSESACDMQMTWDPTGADAEHKLKLKIYKEQGVDRTIGSNNPSGRPIVFRETLNDLGTTYDGDASGVKTALIIKTDLGWQEVVSSVYGAVRTEEFVSIGGTEELAQSTALAEAAFEKVGAPVESIEVKALAVPDLMPFKDFYVGDWVLAPNADGNLIKQRVVAIVYGEDAEGATTYVPQFNTLPTNKIVRATQWLRTMADGTASGRIANASVASLPNTSKPNMANSYEVPFTLTEVEPSVSQRYTPSHDSLLVEVYASLVAGGTSVTTLGVLKNGIQIATFDIVAGAHSGSVDLADLFVGGTDYLQIAVLAGGTGAGGLTAQARFS